MCLLSVPVRISTCRYYRPRTRSHHYPNFSSLMYPTRSTHTPHLVTGGLWNCQSAIRKKDFISGFATQHSLDFLALTETWITPDNTSTTAALSSAFSFTHTPRPTGRGGGTGLLISPKFSFSLNQLPLFTPMSFQFYAVTVTHPVQWTIVVLYHPPGSFGDFLEELDVLLTNFPENGPTLILLGAFNIQTEKSSDLLLLLSSFPLSLSPSPPTQKAGNHLDYIFTRNCSTSNLTVTPLHVSDHFFISYFLPLSQTGNPTTSTDSVPVRRNIRLTRCAQTEPLCEHQKGNGENRNTLTTCSLINLFPPLSLPQFLQPKALFTKPEFNTHFWTPKNSYLFQPLFSPIWNTGSSTNLCLSDWHLSVDVRTPPEK